MLKYKPRYDEDLSVAMQGEESEEKMLLREFAEGTHTTMCFDLEDKKAAKRMASRLDDFAKTRGYGVRAISRGVTCWVMRNDHPVAVSLAARKARAEEREKKRTEAMLLMKAAEKKAGPAEGPKEEPEPVPEPVREPEKPKKEKAKGKGRPLTSKKTKPQNMTKKQLERHIKEQDEDNRADDENGCYCIYDQDRNMFLTESGFNRDEDAREFQTLVEARRAARAYHCAGGTYMQIIGDSGKRYRL